MRTKTSKIRTVLLVFLLVAISLFSLQRTHAKPIAKTMHNCHYCMEFIDAEYLDADEDFLEDDTRFSVDLFFDSVIFNGRTIKLNCYFEIITPSGYIYDYTCFIIMGCQNCIFIFDVYDTITEPGWYTIDFHSNFEYKGITYSSFCTTIFDPPTEGEEGSGGPTMSL